MSRRHIALLCLVIALGVFAGADRLLHSHLTTGELFGRFWWLYTTTTIGIGVGLITKRGE